MPRKGTLCTCRCDERSAEGAEDAAPESSLARELFRTCVQVEILQLRSHHGRADDAGNAEDPPADEEEQTATRGDRDLLQCEVQNEVLEQEAVGKDQEADAEHRHRDAQAGHTCEDEHSEKAVDGAGNEVEFLQHVHSLLFGCG